LGHRRLAVLSIEPGPEQAVRGYRGPLARRMAGIVGALAELGMTMADVALAEVPVTRTDGYQATKALLAARPVTAIVALSDVLAFGAVDALHDLGVDIPEQVSITDFDDLTESSWL